MNKYLIKIIIYSRNYHTLLEQTIDISYIYDKRIFYDKYNEESNLKFSLLFNTSYCLSLFNSFELNI